MVICRKCTWAADTYGDAEWMEGADSQRGEDRELAGRMKAAAAEAHTECANGTQECDCQHWLPGRRTQIVRQWRIRGSGWVVLVPEIPSRCDACFQRIATTKTGVIWRHKLTGHGQEPGEICPGSGMAPLARVTAPSATSSSEPGGSDSSSTPVTSSDGPAAE